MKSKTIAAIKQKSKEIAFLAYLRLSVRIKIGAVLIQDGLFRIVNKLEN